jgi:hypothetical protein
MLIDILLKRVISGGFFKTATFEKDLTGVIDQVKEKKITLPAIYLVPVNAKGSEPTFGNGISQQKITNYSFLIVGENSGDEPISTHVKELSACVFGFQTSPEVLPMWYVGGEIFDINPRHFFWREDYANSITLKKLIRS